MKMAETHLKIFVVEDDEWYNRLLVHTLSLNADYEIRSFNTAAGFLEALHEAPDIPTTTFSPFPFFIFCEEIL